MLRADLCCAVMKAAHVELIRASDEKKKLLEAEREILQRSLNDSSESESPRPNRMKIMVVSPPAAALDLADFKFGMYRRCCRLFGKHFY